jgi:hypothetical protein
MLFGDSLRPAERCKDCVDGVIEGDALVLSTIGVDEKRESSSWNDTQHKKECDICLGQDIKTRMNGVEGFPKLLW